MTVWAPPTARRPGAFPGGSKAQDRYTPPMTRLLNYFHRLLLGLWMGALVCFGAVVAPALFQVLTPSDAGAVVQRLFPKLDAFTVAAGFTLLCLGVAAEGLPPGRARWRLGVRGAMTGLALVSALAITPRMAALRAQAGGNVSTLALDSPLRREFGRLHGVSSALMLGEVLLGLWLLALPFGRDGAQGALASSKGPAPRPGSAGAH